MQKHLLEISNVKVIKVTEFLAMFIIKLDE